jgi:hypothetical protein
MYLGRASNVGGGNCAPAVGTEVNGRDIVPAGGSTSRRVKRGFKRGVFRGGHPQRLGLEGGGRERGRAGMSGLTAAEGFAPSIAARIDGRWESFKRCQRGTM